MGGTGAGAVVPPSDDEVWREISALKRQYQELFAIASGGKAIATAVQTGLGTLATSGTTWAGPVASPSTISSTGDLTVGGLIRNVSAYSNPITTSFRAVWVTSVDGQFGFNLSSREFKENIKSAVIDPAAVLQLRVVTYRYIQAVELLGEDAETEVGLIAEEVDELGLKWLVEYQDGKPIGIKFHLIAMALIAVVQDHEARLAALEARA